VGDGLVEQFQAAVVGRSGPAATYRLVAEELLLVAAVAALDLDRRPD
jgi:hypothetical protein